MKAQLLLFFSLLNLGKLLSERLIYTSTPISRSSFPDDFVFGAGSSAYQFEGAANVDGRRQSIWDTFTREHPEKIADHSNGVVAEDFYHMYQKDITLMKQIGLDSYRFSMSWPRILPYGKISRGVNWEGVNFYNHLINNLLTNGIRPFVTLFHWDIPQSLEDEYGGLLSPKIMNDYYEYADFCFKEFGDRVKDWVTVNEPNLMSQNGYAEGTYAPGRCSSYIGNCSQGNSATEPYLGSQGGIIGISINTRWFVAKYENIASRLAAFRARDFNFGWIIDPITHGDYPAIMRYLVGERLPRFTKEEAEMVKGSFDFIGINYYSSNYAEDVTSYSYVNLSYTTDARVNLTSEKDGIPIGEPTDLSWLYIYPKGLQQIMLHINRKYDSPIIYITENGMGYNSSLSMEDALEDTLRIKYHHLHLSYLLKSIKKGVDVRGYYIWSFLDDFEWSLGYTAKFGITYVDYQNHLKRSLKYSALWFNKFLETPNATQSALLYCDL